MNEEEPLVSKSTLWKRIRNLDVPKETKKALRDLWHKAKRLTQALVEWLYKYRHFSQSVLLGVALAYLVHPLPVAGPILASLSVSLSVLYGIALQMHYELLSHFGERPQEVWI